MQSRRQIEKICFKEKRKYTFLVYFFIPYNIIVEFCCDSCATRREFFKENVLCPHCKKIKFPCSPAMVEDSLLLESHECCFFALPH